MMGSLQGRRILVVEDEFYIALELLDGLRQAGATVLGPVSNLEDAMRQVDTEPTLDAAVLDVNLLTSPVYALADRLQAAGVPFVFATGYSPKDVPARFAAVPHLAKPVDPDRVIAAVCQTVS